MLKKKKNTKWNTNEKRLHKWSEFYLLYNNVIISMYDFIYSAILQLYFYTILFTLWLFIYICIINI